MAIRIPSKNIYGSPQNAKVRDNVVERIEVYANEVVADNEYETMVFSKNFIATKDLITDELIENTKIDVSTNGAIGGGMQSFYISAAYVGYLEQKTFNIDIKIPILLTNKYINNILTKTNKDGYENIQYSLFGVERKGGAWAEWGVTYDGTIKITEGNISYSEPTFTSEEKRLEFPQKIEVTENSNPFVVVSIAEQNLKSWGNLKTAEANRETIDGIEYFTLSLQLMCGVRVVKMTDYIFKSGNASGFTKPDKVNFEGEYVLYEPTAVEISILGNTIGIDLQENAVYIPKNDKTSKKVISFDGNELMQISNYKVLNNKSEVGFSENVVEGGLNNYYVQYKNGQKRNYDSVVNFAYGDYKKQVIIPKGETRALAVKYIDNRLEEFSIISSIAKLPQIETFYEKTKQQYQRGKETATIRCSISDYFDGDEKIISIDNSTGKMSFKMYDQVIPMVYGSDGKDQPMSLYKDGSAKVFKVLGSKIYYDGAVWQELSLQEIDKSEIL